jgi:hypothetical protein
MARVQTAGSVPSEVVIRGVESWPHGARPHERSLPWRRSRRSSEHVKDHDVAIAGTSSDDTGKVRRDDNTRSESSIIKAISE